MQNDVTLQSGHVYMSENSFCEIATETCLAICDKAKSSLDLLSDSEATMILAELPNSASMTCPQATDSSTSLDPQETSSPFVPNDTYRGRFMAGREDEYAATEQTYQALYESPSNSHLMGIRECRKYAEFKREKQTGDVKVFSYSCRDRWCPMCSGQKASYAKDATEVYLKAMTAPRFLTLTLKNDISDLKSQIEFLQQSFRRIRQRAYWKKNVTGGIWFLQVKRGKNSGCWHPHLHIVIDGEYMEQARLSALWDLVTFGSPVIDIQSITNPEETAKYVARYCARPAYLKDMPLTDRVEVVTALFGKRLCGTFGNAKAVTLTPPKVEDTGEWSTIGYHDEVVNKARTSPAAKAVLRCYYSGEPMSETAFEEYTGQPVNFTLADYVPKKEPQLYLDFY